MARVPIHQVSVESEIKAQQVYEEALKKAQELQKHYNDRLNVMDWTATLGRVSSFLAAGFGTGTVAAGESTDTQRGVRAIVPATAIAAVVFEALNRGFQTERRREIYGRASAVIDCVIRATSPDVEQNIQLTRHRIEVRESELKKRVHELAKLEEDPPQGTEIEWLQNERGRAKEELRKVSAELRIYRKLDRISDTDRARALYQALYSIHGSVVSELSGTHLGGAKSLAGNGGGGEELSFVTLEQRIDACLTRLVTVVEG